MPNGEEIANIDGSDTFVKVIEKLGIEKVKTIPIVVVRKRQLYLVSDDKDPFHTQRPSGKYYVATNSSSVKKIDYLHQIAAGLGLRMKRINEESPPIFELSYRRT